MQENLLFRSPCTNFAASGIALHGGGVLAIQLVVLLRRTEVDEHRLALAVGLFL